MTSEIVNPGPFTRLASRSRADQVRDQLAEAIRNGTYSTGDKLPSERALTEMLGVSRVSLREGLRSLEAIGMITVQHGNGYFVTGTARAPGVDAVKWVSEHRDEVIDMMLVRGGLDELAAAEAALRATATQRRAIGEAHAAFAHAVARDDRDLAVIADLDIAFHLAIAEASGSSLLIDLLGELHQHLRQARSAGFTPPGRLELSVREHQEIAEAIINGEAQAARAATTIHILHVKQMLGSIDTTEYGSPAGQTWSRPL